MSQPIGRDDGLSDATRTAITALSAFGTTLTREQAAGLLPMWGRYGTLTPADRAAVLGHYPTAEDLAALASLAHRVRAAGGGR